jgi:hypothetical protein
MEYVRIVRKKVYGSFLEPKIHILGSNNKLACGVDIKTKYESILDVDQDKICVRCLAAEGIKPMERSIVLKAFVVKIIKPVMDNCDPAKARESLLDACDQLADSLSQFNVKCHYVVEANYKNDFSGKIVFEGKRYMYLKFNYRPKRKDRMKFEANTREYLIKSVEDAFA